MHMFFIFCLLLIFFAGITIFNVKQRLLLMYWNPLPHIPFLIQFTLEKPMLKRFLQVFYCTKTMFCVCDILCLQCKAINVRHFERIFVENTLIFPTHTIYIYSYNHIYKYIFRLQFTLKRTNLIFFNR